MGTNMEEAWFTVESLYPNIWGIAEFGHNEKVISYLFVGKNQALLFDTGMGIGDIKKEVEKITHLPITVVNSHCHFDHIGSNKLFKNTYLFDCSWSKEKALSGYSAQELSSYLKPDLFFQSPPKGFDVIKHTTSSFKYTHLLQDKDTIDVMPFQFEIIHTPGHTPDSICLLEKNTGILLTGDSLYPGPIYLQFGESKFEDYVSSVRKLSKITNITTILPAHNEFYMNSDIISVLLNKLLQDTSGRKEIKITNTVLVLMK